jgi:hypothetical protein
MCPYEFDSKLPESVSLTLDTCDKAKNVMKIIDNQPTNGIKKNFAVCTKPLSITGSIDPIRLVEWIETLKILGAQQIYIYHRYFNPDIFEVAQFYEAQGFMVLEQYLEPSGISGAFDHTYESYINEFPILNDCLYRAKNVYKFVIALDYDEVLIPVRESDYTWKNLIDYLKSDEEVHAYGFRSVIYNKQIDRYSDKVPPYFYMLQHVQRAVNFSNVKTKRFSYKSIIDPDYVMELYAHGAAACWNGNCSIRYLDESIAQCSHYRDAVLKSSDNNTQEDITFWKYKDELVAAVERTLDEMNFVRPLMTNKRKED